MIRFFFFKGAYRRIVSYKFGQFNVLVRFEVDCIEKQTENEASSACASSSQTSSNEDATVDALLDKMLRMNLNLGEAKKFDNDSDSSSLLRFIEYGQFDANEHHIELATRSTRSINLDEKKWSQLFFAQIETLIVGWHTRGNLDKIEKISFEEVRFHFIITFFLSWT